MVSFFAFISCNHSTSSPAQNDAAKRPLAIDNIRKDSFAAPGVIPINAGNKPKVVKAGKPVIKIDSSNGGAPLFLFTTTLNKRY